MTTRTRRPTSRRSSTGRSFHVASGPSRTRVSSARRSSPGTHDPSALGHRLHDTRVRPLRMREKDNGVQAVHPAGRFRSSPGSLREQGAATAGRSAGGLDQQAGEGARRGGDSSLNFSGMCLKIVDTLRKKLYDMRTQVERIISRVKRVLSFERFYGRGTEALQGFADRYVTVFNIIAFAAWAT